MSVVRACVLLASVLVSYAIQGLIYLNSLCCDLYMYSLAQQLRNSLALTILFTHRFGDAVARMYRKA